MSDLNSPGVVVKESDLTITTQTDNTNSGAFVGMFNWGAVEDLVLVGGGESDLIRKFTKPQADNAVDFALASAFLSYGSALYVVRIEGENALNAVPTGEVPVLVKNQKDFENGSFNGLSVIAKYPGALANGLKIETAHGSAYDSWEYADEFEYAPNSDEFHVVVVDTLGAFSGIAGSVLEKYDFLKETEGGKRPDGTTSYYADVINAASNYILVADTSTSMILDNAVRSIPLSGGANDFANAQASYQNAWDLFASVDDVSVRYLIAGNTTAVNSGYVVDLATQREDCMAFVSPEISDVVNVADPLTNVLAFRNSDLNRNTSYGFMDDNWKYTYDKYTNKNIWIPCCADTAGLWARRDNVWDSAAGYGNGQIKNAIKLAWNPNKAERGQLFKKQVNSVISQPGAGTMLFGDKTLLTRPSVFSGANVRFLFIMLRNSVADSAKYNLFKLNTIATRSRFTNQTTSFLRSIKSQGGIIEFSVICDERNNPEQSINEGKFVGTITILPPQSIRNVVLEFNAVNSQVQFSEIEAALAA